MSGCPIVTVTRPRRRRLPSTLTAACGWTCAVAQGVEWATHPARLRWAGHTCHQTETTP